MKIKVSELKKIIKEEVIKILGEQPLPRKFARTSDPRVMQPDEEEAALGSEIPDLTSEEQAIIDAMGGGDTSRRGEEIEYTNKELSVLMPDEIRNRLQQKGIMVDRVIDVDVGVWALEGVRV